MRALTLGLCAVLWVSVASGFAGAQSPSAGPPVQSVFMLMTVDRNTRRPYDYGSAFFFGIGNNAYTASHVIAQAAKEPNLMLVAIVHGVEYVAHVQCWNPASSDRIEAFNRDVAIVHVGPDVPTFSLGPYAPATTALVETPLRVRADLTPTKSQIVSIVGFGKHFDRPIAQRVEQGRVTQVLRTQDRTVIVTMRFPAAAAPTNGDSGGPILDAQGRVVGIAVWEKTVSISPRYAELSGVAAASLGCVTVFPSGPHDSTLSTRR